MSNLSRKPSSAVSSSPAHVVLVASAAFLLVVAIFILVSAVASPISRGSGTAPTPSSSPPTNTVPSTATSRSSPTPASGTTEFPDLLQLALGGAVLVLIVLIFRIASSRDDE
jgi:uncharacterized integral membrane protein